MTLMKMEILQINACTNMAIDHDPLWPVTDNGNAPADDENISITDANESVAYITGTSNCSC